MTNADSRSLAEILFPESQNQQEFAESILSIPPEQRKLHTDTYDFPIETLITKIDDKSVFIPQFQRKYVWTDQQASRLIESLIIQCPMPVIYLNQDNDERLAVIDGNQRVTSIHRFINNHFSLKGLTSYPELEGNRFHELDPRFQRHISNRTLRCIVILKDTHPQVKFDVFERLNTGATKLNPQELRHGLYFGDLMLLAEKMVKNSGILSMLDIKVDKRMKSEELILRFWSLSERFDSYSKPLASFINKFASENRKIDIKDQERLEKEYIIVLESVKKLLGSLAFRLFDSELNVISTFNSAIYDAIMIGFSQLGKERKLKNLTMEEAQKLLGTLIQNDEKFRRSISVATSDETQVKYRVEAIKRVFGK